MREIVKSAVGDLTGPRLVVWAAFTGLVGVITPQVLAGASFRVQCVTIGIICVLLRGLVYKIVPKPEQP